jgi:hypothetical protein
MIQELMYSCSVARPAGILELDPGLVWVRGEQKAAAKGARFGAHFTQMYRVPVHGKTNQFLNDFIQMP